VVLTERGRGGDEHEPQDHGREHGADDGAYSRPGEACLARGVLARLLRASAHGLPHVHVAGESGAEQRDAARELVVAQR